VDQQRTKEHAREFEDEIGTLTVERIVRTPIWKLLLSGSDVRKRGLRRYALLIYAIATVGLIYAASRPRLSVDPASLRSQCKNNLKWIGLALRNYHDQHGSFPPAYFTDESGRPAHSWRVLILPFLDEHALYREYRFDEPWDGPHNSKLTDRIPAPYRCPRFVEEIGRQKSNSTRLTNYIAISASHAVFDGSNSTSMSDVTDDAANKILLSETRKYSVHWMQPEDVSPDQLFSELQAATYSGKS
jgi:hypothetical protein